MLKVSFRKFKNRKIIIIFMRNTNIYHLIKHIFVYGEMENGRNGNALTIYGSAMHFSLDNNKILPILTTKKVAWKTCAYEIIMVY